MYNLKTNRPTNKNDVKRTNNSFPNMKDQSKEQDNYYTTSSEEKC